ncbi:transposase [Microcoleus sp. T2B6]|uniref:transposase n=1 Tax=Microcoleus sp. T2B6 TaxID=3055424 RepID=UPI002FCE8482
MSVKIAHTEFKDWLNYVQIFFQESTSTIVNYFEGICNYFLNRTTSRVISGINNRIKLIMRQGYGFSNFDNFREAY